MDHRYNRFGEFFSESVCFTAQSEELEQQGDTALASSYAKTAILAAVFALEAVANELIHSLNLSVKKFEEIDYGGIRRKYAFFMEQRGMTGFDEQGSEVSGLKDLVRFRNRQVHSKPDLETLDEDADGSLRYPQVESTPHLNIPYRSMFVEPKHAIAALKASDSFLEIFFLTWCGMSRKEATRYFLHHELHDGRSPFAMATPLFSRFESDFDRFQIGLRYIDRHHFNATFTRRAKDSA